MLFSNYVWDIPNHENKVYLTFDDGPTPEITNWVLNELEKHNAKATFFCIGENVQKHPEILVEVIKKGHSIGNHTFNHWNGWNTTTEKYLKNVELCQDNFGKLNTEHCKLFRPPYGKIKPSQSKKLRALGYKIIMWDVLSVDFEKETTPEECLENVIKNSVSGSIIVFHDSEKAFKNLKYTLPKTLEILSSKGFCFDSIR